MNIEWYQPELNLRVRIPVSIISGIEKSLRSHYPKEFGGIFVGHYSENEKIAFIDSIIKSEVYENDSRTFVCYPDNLNEKLAVIYERSKGKLIYLGEWHSHINSTASPSRTDIETLVAISRSNDVSITTPILLIISLYQKTTDFEVFVLYKEEMYKYLRQD